MKKKKFRPPTRNRIPPPPPPRRNFCKSPSPPKTSKPRIANVHMSPRLATPLPPKPLLGYDPLGPGRGRAQGRRQSEHPTGRQAPGGRPRATEIPAPRSVHPLNPETSQSQAPKSPMTASHTQPGIEITIPGATRHQTYPLPATLPSQPSCLVLAAPPTSQPTVATDECQ